jgi:hypothetical protein
MENQFDSSSLSVTSGIGSALMRILMSDDIQPGTDISYQLAKDILIYHPLGQKMAEAPISMAQSQVREVSVQDAPEEVVKAFTSEWDTLDCSAHIHNVCKLSRVYGLASLVMGCEGIPSNEPIDLWQAYKLPIYFSELDPLNTAGSLVLSQVPTSPDFNKPARVASQGMEFHRSRYVVVMNEQPVYLSYTVSAYGFVGRSVYQRALFPLKSFIRTMIADDMIATKLALLITKQKSPGSVINQIMQQLSGMKRALLKRAYSGQVLAIDITEDIETLNMQNVEGAGVYARGNILKNVATAADMPAKLLENETMVAGFGEGTEDAKNIATYIDRIRIWLDPCYRYFDNIVRYRAWNEQFYKTIQAKYPDRWGKVAYKDAFSQWCDQFAAEWPSVLREPESEAVKVENTKFDTCIALLNALLPVLDGDNKTQLIQSVLDNVNENKRLFAHDFGLDYEALKDYLNEQQERSEEGAELDNEAKVQEPKPKAKIGAGR